MTAVQVSTPWFVAASTEARSRLFLLTADGPAGEPALTQVTTVPWVPARAARLVAALNGAVGTGDRSEVDALLAGLPEPVAVACRHALDVASAGRAEDVADSGRQIREYWSGPGDLAEEFRSAITLGLMLVVTNQASDGEVEFRSALYDQDVEVPYSPAPQWLPVPDGMALVDRSYPTEEELSAAFADPRWTTLHSRAFWVWVQEEGHPDSASVEIVVEHFDRALDVREAFRQFQVDDDGDPESRGPLTVRNRFDLYCTLLAMTADLDTLVSDWKHSPDSVVRDDMPLVVHDQPRKWWAEVAASTDRLLEASRTGSLVELEPRSVAEEVLLALATRTSYVAWGHDTAELVGVYPPVETLPRDVEWDGRHEEILPHLVGDVDVEMLWDRRLDGIGDPSDTVNVILRIGDLRPAAWHHARNA